MLFKYFGDIGAMLFESGIRVRCYQTRDRTNRKVNFSYYVLAMLITTNRCHSQDLLPFMGRTFLGNASKEG